MPPLSARVKTRSLRSLTFGKGEDKAVQQTMAEISMAEIFEVLSHLGLPERYPQIQWFVFSL
jgi:hypothetical protein